MVGAERCRPTHGGASYLLPMVIITQSSILIWYLYEAPSCTVCVMVGFSREANINESSLAAPSSCCNRKVVQAPTDAVVAR